MSSSLPPARSYLVGCLLVVLGGLVLSLGVHCVRGASASDAWEYLLWRALAFALVLSLVPAQRHRISPLLQMRQLGGIAWVSVHTATKPISPNLLQQALGPETVDGLTRETGMPLEDLLSQLSRLLPEVIDKLSPHGKLPKTANFFQNQLMLQRERIKSG